MDSLSPSNITSTTKTDNASSNMCTNPDQQGKNDQHREIPPGSSDVGDIDKEVPTGSETLLANTTSSTESSNGKVDYGNDDGVDLDTQCASNHLVHNDGAPEDIRKSFISSLRCIISSSCHQHKIAAVYYQARHNMYIFLPTQILVRHIYYIQRSYCTRTELFSRSLFFSLKITTSYNNHVSFPFFEYQ